MHILLVEDNKILQSNIIKYFKLEGISCHGLGSGKQVPLELVKAHYDCIILDVSLEDSNGLDICKYLREKGENIPILMLTSHSLTKEKIMGLNAGADDYMTKPFDYEELLARVKTLLRRNFSIKSSTIQYKDIIIHQENQQVFVKNQLIHLSSQEFNLLLFLIQNQGKVLSKKQIIEYVWGEYDEFTNSRTLDVYIGYLRKKIGKDIIQTKRGIGYMIAKYGK